ncbi:hypothetical protein SDC9_97322 [bioreactor metagenome]|uniref:PRTase-CE domain-containing protein n=1 Tax=bioreactor metagenome TaxID=1076179 RepID=A0A645ABN9_9ZZZZ
MDVIDDADLPFIDNFVFIDDFSGTGKSFINELKKNTSRYNGKNVYFITINIMISATRKIECYCRENNIKIIILSEFRQDKTFSRNLFDDNSKAKEEITTMSEDLIIPESEIMGFKKSQALVAFYNNTPNNTLGFIRYDTKKYNSIFPRRNDIVPGWINMKRARMARKTTNYNSKAEE